MGWSQKKVYPTRHSKAIIWADKLQREPLISSHQDQFFRLSRTKTMLQPCGIKILPILFSYTQRGSKNYKRIKLQILFSYEDAQASHVRSKNLYGEEIFINNDKKRHRGYVNINCDPKVNERCHTSCLHCLWNYMSIELERRIFPRANYLFMTRISRKKKQLMISTMVMRVATWKFLKGKFSLLFIHQESASYSELFTLGSLLGETHKSCQSLAPRAFTFVVTTSPAKNRNVSHEKAFFI